MVKSADAFRTISEVAEWLDTPAHVLRFWESKFSQVKPVKRAGGRRYYRPVDMELLGGIKRLLHDDGMTIKGVQKILREQGIKHVAAMSPVLDDLVAPIDEPDITDVEIEVAEDIETESAEVLQFQPNETDATAEPDADAQAEPESEVLQDEAKPEETVAETPLDEPVEPEPQTPEPEQESTFLAASSLDPSEPDIIEDVSDAAPAFTHRTSEPAEMPASEPEPEPEPAPRPRIVETPPDPTEATTTAAPGVLSRLAAQKKPLSAQQAADLAPLVARLSALRDKLAQSRRD